MQAGDKEHAGEGGMQCMLGLYDEMKQLAVSQCRL